MKLHNSPRPGPAARRPAPAQAGNPLATILWGVAAALEVLIVVLGVLLLVQYRQRMADYPPRQRGEAYLRLENYRQAQSCFARALREDGPDPELYLLHGLASAQVQDDGALRGDVTALEELWPDRADLLARWQQTLREGVLLTCTDTDGTQRRYRYNLLGQCTSVQMTHGAESVWGDCVYSQEGRLLERVWYQDRKTGEALGREAYTYNEENGWLTKVTYTGADGSGQGTLSMTYNKGGNLTRIRAEGAAFDGTMTFDYDGSGNCTACSQQGTFPGMRQELAVAVDRSYTYQAGASGCGFRLDPLEGLVEPRFVTGVTSRTGQQTDSLTCTVDAEGRRLSSSGAGTDSQYTYDGQGRLLTVTQNSDSGSRTVTYTYGSLAKALAE